MYFAPPLNDPASMSDDPYLMPYAGALAGRRENFRLRRDALAGSDGSLAEFANAHEYYGMHFRDGGWTFREWAPNATALFLVGDFNNWTVCAEYSLSRINDRGDWGIVLPESAISHGMHYKLVVEWGGGSGDRIPAYARYVVQDPDTHVFSAVVWHPEEPYVFKNPNPVKPAATLIYESHVGMAQEEPKIGSFREYQEKVLPRIAAGGYNTVQLMAVMSHPYYGSFGYHVANFFSIAGIFGTPDEFKELVDAAHGLGLRVIIDLIHSHAVKNEVEGLARFDGTRYAYFHAGEKGEHRQWDSLCFDYDKTEVLHFLLSNCRFWLDEYHLDGFRFDGITSMLYHHHGLGKAFTSYDDYFNGDVSESAITYLTLANAVIHEVNPEAVTIAEDVSGMPGLASAEGIGFDCRMAMGVTDMWFKLFDLPDESWNMHYLWHELTNRRSDERTVSYVECHDQAIVGGQSAIFRLAGAAMYDAMSCHISNLQIDRAVALHKMARLATMACAGHGYLNFMGNEFGHPEWIDFPREGNGWSYWYARRQWSLADNGLLRYHGLGLFDRDMMKLASNEFFSRRTQLIKLDDLAKILIFERDGLIFCFNFHPGASVSDYTVELPPGVYRLKLNSDAKEYCGFGMVQPDQRYFTCKTPASDGSTYQAVKLYLPCRCALVLEKEKKKQQHK